MEIYKVLHWSILFPPYIYRCKQMAFMELELGSTSLWMNWVQALKTNMIEIYEIRLLYMIQSATFFNLISTPKPQIKLKYGSLLKNGFIPQAVRAAAFELPFVVEVLQWSQYPCYPNHNIITNTRNQHDTNNKENKTKNQKTLM